MTRFDKFKTKARQILIASAFLLLLASQSAKGEVFALVKFDESLLENGSLKSYVMSEKLDGIRALWDGKALKSRSGKKFSVPKCWTQNFPPFALDGELFIARGKFEELLSVVNSTNATCEAWQSVKYFVFDVPKADGTLIERLKTLENYLTTQENARTSTPTSQSTQTSAYKNTRQIFITEQKPIHSKAQLEKALQSVVKSGGEGLVVRKNAAPYESFRTKNAMKLKLYEDAECKVVKHNAGKGKFAHKLGSLTCEQAFTDAKGRTQTKRFKIGSGFTDKERANPPPLNSLITYKFNGYTAKGIPKFPVFLRIYTPQ